MIVIGADPFAEFLKQAVEEVAAIDAAERA
jgi:hypothetical protein